MEVKRVPPVGRSEAEQNYIDKLSKRDFNDVDFTVIPKSKLLIYVLTFNYRDTTEVISLHKTQSGAESRRQEKYIEIQQRINRRLFTLDIEKMELEE